MFRILKNSRILVLVARRRILKIPPKYHTRQYPGNRIFHFCERNNSSPLPSIRFPRLEKSRIRLNFAKFLAWNTRKTRRSERRWNGASFIAGGHDGEQGGESNSQTYFRDKIRVAAREARYKAEFAREIVFCPNRVLRIFTADSKIGERSFESIERRKENEFEGSRSFLRKFGVCRFFAPLAIKEGRLNEFGINLCSLLIKGSRTVAKKCGNYVYRGRSCGRLITWEWDKIRWEWCKTFILRLWY